MELTDDELTILGVKRGSSVGSAIVALNNRMLCYPDWEQDLCKLYIKIVRTMASRLMSKPKAGVAGNHPLPRLSCKHMPHLDSRSHSSESDLPGNPLLSLGLRKVAKQALAVLDSPGYDLPILHPAFRMPGE